MDESKVSNLIFLSENRPSSQVLLPSLILDNIVFTTRYIELTSAKVISHLHNNCFRQGELIGPVNNTWSTQVTVKPSFARVQMFF